MELEDFPAPYSSCQLRKAPVVTGPAAHSLFSPAGRSAERSEATRGRLGQYPTCGPHPALRATFSPREKSVRMPTPGDDVYPRACLPPPEVPRPTDNSKKFIPVFPRSENTGHTAQASPAGVLRETVVDRGRLVPVVIAVTCGPDGGGWCPGGKPLSKRLPRGFQAAVWLSHASFG